MTVVGETRRVKEGSKHAARGREKLYLLIKCDQCGSQFERGNGNLRKIRERPRHFCGPECHRLSMKRGGKSDESRRTSCREKYGADYFINLSDVASRSGKAAHSPELEARRRATNKKNLESYTIRLRRGLSLCRSRAEIDFLSALAYELEDELEYQKYANGWWIDAYSPKYNCWIQFDGIYWHSRPINAQRDHDQDAWFAATGQRLLRITDREAAVPGSIQRFAELVSSGELKSSLLVEAGLPDPEDVGST
jgi:very-short-patch-repair endonuclease